MNERITVRVTDEMKHALERVYQDQTIPGRTRQDTLRFILEEWLIERGYLARTGNNQGRETYPTER